MCCRMFRQPWHVRGRFRETLKGSVGNWLLSWSTGHSNGLLYRVLIYSVQGAIRPFQPVYPRYCQEDAGACSSQMAAIPAASACKNCPPFSVVTPPSAKTGISAATLQARSSNASPVPGRVCVLLSSSLRAGLITFRTPGRIGCSLLSALRNLHFRQRNP
jgi:hypothetical protein